MNIPEGEGGKMSGIIRKSVSNNASAQKRVMTPLPISQSVLERIDALGPEMQPMQKYILLMGIALDFYAKTQLIRELRRFALQGSSGGWAWFSMVFLFFLLSGSCTTAYWLLHYPMPTKEEVARLGEKQTKVFGFTKLDFKKMVRNAGAVCAMCQLGTAFAARRALRTNDLRQRKAEMDLRGMQLVDTVFLILPAATLQAYVGMACSSPDIVCPGRTGFDILLFLAVFGAITSATLCVHLPRPAREAPELHVAAVLGGAQGASLGDGGEGDFPFSRALRAHLAHRALLRRQGRMDLLRVFHARRDRARRAAGVAQNRRRRHPRQARVGQDCLDEGVSTSTGDGGRRSGASFAFPSSTTPSCSPRR